MCGARSSLPAFDLTARKAAAWGGVQARIPLQATFPPDGRWVTYQSNEPASASEIFVQPFPDAGAKFMLPPNSGNHHPLWSPTGKEIFFIPRQGVTAAAAVTTEPQGAFGGSVEIPRGGRVEGPPGATRNHDMLPDGNRFAGIIPAGSEQSVAAWATQIRIVLNWFEDLKQRVSR